MRSAMNAIGVRCGAQDGGFSQSGSVKLRGRGLKSFDYELQGSWISIGQIAATDAEIDRLVYELYGLSEAEIKIVEEATGKG
jgi:hypothetical protein